VASDARSESSVADLREGGVWSFRQSLKNGALCLVARTLLAALGPLPRAWIVAAGRGLGGVLHATLGSARRMAMGNLSVLEHLDEKARTALVRRTFRVLGENLGDTVDLYGKASLSHVFPLEEGSKETLVTARAEGRGVVFASAHLGPWERVAASLVRAGVPLVTLAREAYDPRLTAVLVRLRERHGVRAIFRGSPGAAARILRTLKRGEVLGAPMDLASRVPSIDIPFLGRLARTAVGPARLALRTGAAVVVGTFVTSGEIRVRRICTDDLRADGAGEAELCRRINAEISTRIASAPEHWPWMHDRYGGVGTNARWESGKPERESSRNL
jgi:Kdo2-lipid IVA lauroyltransferase/acyltransferase